MNNQLERLINEIADLKAQVAAQTKAQEAKADSQKVIVDQILELTQKWLGDDCESESEGSVSEESECSDEETTPDDTYALQVKGTVLEFLNSQKDEVTRNTIYKHMEQYSAHKDVVSDALNELVQDKEIRQVSKHTFKRIVRRPKSD